MRPMVLLLAGCLDAPTGAPALHGVHAIDSPQAMLIPCVTPSGQRAALGVIAGETCGSTPPRDCRAWRELLQHRFACQPGTTPTTHADAIVFWLEDGEANHIARRRCGSAPEPIYGEAYLTDAGTVDFDADGLLGAQAFRACP